MSVSTFSTFSPSLSLSSLLSSLITVNGSRWLLVTAAAAVAAAAVRCFLAGGELAVLAVAAAAAVTVLCQLLRPQLCPRLHVLPEVHTKGICG